MSYAKHSVSKQKKAMELLRKGLTMRAVGAALNVPVSTVYTWKARALRDAECAAAFEEEETAGAQALAAECEAIAADSAAEHERTGRKRHKWEIEGERAAQAIAAEIAADTTAPVAIEPGSIASDADAVRSAMASRDAVAQASAVMSEGGGMASAALFIDEKCDESAWRSLGGLRGVDGFFDARQSARIFHAVAIGVPIPIAFERVGGKAGDAQILESRAKDGGKIGDWWRALKACQAWAIERLNVRVYEGFAGWQGAKALLSSLRPEYYGDADERSVFEGEDSIKEMDRDELFKVVLIQVFRRLRTDFAGDPMIDAFFEVAFAKYGLPNSMPSNELLPLSATGMNEDTENEKEPA